MFIAHCYFVIGDRCTGYSKGKLGNFAEKWVPSVTTDFRRVSITIYISLLLRVTYIALLLFRYTNVMRDCTPLPDTTHPNTNTRVKNNTKNLLFYRARQVRLGKTVFRYLFASNYYYELLH